MVVTVRMRGWLLAVVLGVAGSAWAATTAPRTESASPGPVSALEFRLDGDFNLAPLAGASLSWKYYGANDRGWRLGLTPGSSTENYASSTTDYQNSRQYGLTVECQRLGFMASRSVARPYWGFGIRAGADRWETEAYRDSGDDGLLYREQTATTYRAGLVGTLGAEFIIAGKLVIGAEYSLAATWSRERRVELARDDITEESTDHRDTTTYYSLFSRPVALTIAILF